MVLRRASWTWIQGVMASIRREIGLCGNLGNFLARRARVRDDPGRSLQIELEPEKFLMAYFPGQSVYEQTSGVLRHTESVRGDKVQEQDWREALEQNSGRTTRSPTRRLTSRYHSVPGGHSVTMTKSRRSGLSQTPEAMTQ